MLFLSAETFTSHYKIQIITLITVKSYKYISASLYLLPLLVKEKFLSRNYVEHYVVVTRFLASFRSKQISTVKRKEDRPTTICSWTVKKRSSQETANIALPHTLLDIIGESIELFLPKKTI